MCADGLHGFRYLKITLDALPEDSPYTSGFGEVSISSVGLRWSGYHGTPDTFSGWFECSDKNLTQWWYDGSYTNEMCTDVFRANDTEPRQGFSDSLRGKLVIHDGPKRDRDPYMGDLAVAGLTSYLTHDVHEAARNVSFRTPLNLETRSPAAVDSLLVLFMKNRIKYTLEGLHK